MADEERGGKIPREPEVPLPDGWITPPPTPAQLASRVLMDWIRAHFGDTAGAVDGRRDREALVVYWKGEAPAELRRLADEQPVPVTFEQAAFSLGELMPIAKRLIGDHGAIVESTGPAKDFSGVSVWLKDDAPTAAVEALIADAGVPVVFDRPASRGGGGTGSFSAR
ncbi:hypothetical protein [Kribbella sp. NPDC051718]|uniref:hypothetical protein n=1 Tax=Kribbella sp. NPDC051718 TaxID=3155168 RepID=UPI00343C371C